MKTKEFIEKVEALGLGVEKVEDKNKTLALRVYILTNDASYTIANVSEQTQHYFRFFDSWGLKYLEKERYLKLIELLSEYALTPIEERKDHKKYYLRLPKFFDDEWAYLNYWVEGNEYFFNDKLPKEANQTQFTQEEIDNFPDQNFIKILIKEEVEE